jgi:diguanylate cyclase (GGDEF)-like protein
MVKKFFQFKAFMFTFSGMSNQDLLQKLQDKIRALETLSEVGKAITSSMQPQEVLRVIIKKTSELLNPTSWSLLLLDETSKQLKYELLINEPSIDRTVPVEIGDGINGWVAKYGTPMFSSKEAQFPEFAVPKHLEHFTKNNSFMVAPLKSKNKVFGVINLQRNFREKTSFTEEEFKFLQTISDYAAIAIENSKNFHRIEELTMRDDLTALSNARHFHQILDAEINRYQRNKKPFSMIFMDIDHFKKVNDTYGHVHGSALLCETAEVIQKCIRVVDHAARYGGDEFIIILPETGKEEAYMIAERIRAAVESNKFLERDGLAIHFTASLGVATFPIDGDSKDALIKMSDHAMYNSKKLSRNRVTGAEKP